MLSDAIKQFRTNFSEYEHSGAEMSPEAVASMLFVTRAWELEVRNLEERIEQLERRDRLARPHAPLFPDVRGRVVKFPVLARQPVAPHPEGEPA